MHKLGIALRSRVPSPRRSYSWQRRSSRSARLSSRSQRFRRRASATPTLQEGGVNVTVGSGIAATSSGSTYFTITLGNITCSTFVMYGTVVVNTGKLIETTITQASWDSGGGGPYGSWVGDMTVTPDLSSTSHWCINTTSTTSHTWKLRGGGCNEVEKALTFTLGFSLASPASTARPAVELPAPTKQAKPRSLLLGRLGSRLD
jgi:hypothetical protein